MTLTSHEYLEKMVIPQMKRHVKALIKIRDSIDKKSNLLLWGGIDAEIDIVFDILDEVIAVSREVSRL